MIPIFIPWPLVVEARPPDLRRLDRRDAPVERRAVLDAVVDVADAAQTAKARDRLLRKDDGDPVQHGPVAPAERGGGDGGVDPLLERLLLDRDLRRVARPRDGGPAELDDDLDERPGSRSGSARSRQRRQRCEQADPETKEALQYRMVRRGGAKVGGGSPATMRVRADVAELVDAHGSGPCGRKLVEVQVLSSASPDQALSVPDQCLSRADVLAASRDHSDEKLRTGEGPEFNLAAPMKKTPPERGFLVFEVVETSFSCGAVPAPSERPGCTRGPA